MQEEHNVDNAQPRDYGVGVSHIALEVQERLIAEFAPKIRIMANRLATRLPAHLDVDDIINVGVIGLMDAMTKYDPNRETLFKTYAEFRIRGAMLDEIRAMDWVPRSIREKAARLRGAYQSLEQKLGRPASEEEVSAALGVDLPTLHKLLQQVSHTAVLSLDDLGVDSDREMNILDCIAQEGVPDPLANLIQQDMWDLLGEAIEHLPKKERLVVTLYYYEELTMREIGNVLNITESRVSQLHSQAILRIKGKIASVRSSRGRQSVRSKGSLKDAGHGTEKNRRYVLSTPSGRA
ncbi:MAG: FliA/WhiG family RNA polymerase sigma factor [Nitrospirota bacterium]|nr:FliA/WhiG family RNA polymerase sigma factor [Nitrospirota bacterium]